MKSLSLAPRSYGVLPFATPRSMLAQGALVGAALLLPALCHLFGLPTRILLPMHWPVVLAALLYGWKGGALVGAASPLASFALSGFPFGLSLTAMTVELFTYGAMTGFLKEKGRLNPHVAVLIALLTGRVAFLSVVFFSGTLSTPLKAYAVAALLPGLVALLLQALLLPVLAQRLSRDDR